jgi:Putative zinc-finger
MNCSEFLAQLGDFLDNQVPTGLVHELQVHLDGCDHCVITMETTRKTIEIYRNHEVYELPVGLRDRLQAAILSKCKKGC